MTLGEFVKYLAALLSKNDVPMPFKDEEPWHVLFYRLQEEKYAGKPEFLGRLIFDWGGPFPEVQGSFQIPSVAARDRLRWCAQSFVQENGVERGIGEVVALTDGRIARGSA